MKTNTSDLFTKLCEKKFKTECVKEYHFHDKRRWRFDYALPKFRIAVEVEGGVWTNGRHTRASGFLKDMEKYNTATTMGWRVLRTTPSNLLSSSTLKLIQTTMQNDK